MTTRTSRVSSTSFLSFNFVLLRSTLSLVQFRLISFCFVLSFSFISLHPFRSISFYFVLFHPFCYALSLCLIFHFIPFIRFRFTSSLFRFTLPLSFNFVPFHSISLYLVLLHPFCSILLYFVSFILLRPFHLLCSASSLFVILHFSLFLSVILHFSFVSLSFLRYTRPFHSLSFCFVPLEKKNKICHLWCLAELLHSSQT